MKHVEERETEEGNKFGQQVDRSFYPLPYVQCPNGKKANDQRDDQGRERERCKYLPCHYFDYIGGTSTGGLISIMLGRLRLGVDECIEEYENLGQEVFGHPRLFSIRGRLLSLQEKYDEKRLQRVVNDLVLRRLSDAQLNMGASNFSSASSLCRTVVVAYEGKRIAGTPDYGKPKGEDNSKSSVDVKEGPCLFRSYDHWASPGNTPTIFERNPGSAHSIPLWQVARATSAAPTYFKPVKIQDRIFGDGGFGANNPTEELICEVSQMHGNDRKVIPLVVSIGTGGKPNPGRYEGDGIWKYINLIKAAKAIPTDSDDTGAARLCEVAKIPYFRFNVLRTQGLGEVKLDEWKTKGGIHRRKEHETTLGRIRDMTEAYCEERGVVTKFKDVAKILVEQRRQRCEIPRLWETYATGAQYRCTYDGCRKTQKIRACKEDLRDHLQRRHRVINDVEAAAYIEAGRCCS